MSACKCLPMKAKKGQHKGLGWIEGRIKSIPNKNLKLPHMGWNTVKPIKNDNLIETSDDYYFVHSYYFECVIKKIFWQKPSTE